MLFKAQHEDVQEQLGQELSGKCVPYKLEDLSLIPQNPREESQAWWRVLVVKLLGRQRRGSLGLVDSQCSFLGQFQASERLRLKPKVDSTEK